MPNGMDDLTPPRLRSAYHEEEDRRRVNGCIYFTIGFWTLFFLFGVLVLTGVL